MGLRTCVWSASSAGWSLLAVPDYGPYLVIVIAPFTNDLYIHHPLPCSPLRRTPTTSSSVSICAACAETHAGPRCFRRKQRGCSGLPADRLFTPLTPAAKATDENLASEDWDTNLQICDKVGDEGQNGCVQLRSAELADLAEPAMPSPLS